MGTGSAPASGTVTGSDTDSPLSGPEDPALWFCLLTLGYFLPSSPYMIWCAFEGSFEQSGYSDALSFSARDGTHEREPST